MKTTIFSLILLAGLILVGCAPKHPKIGLLLHSFDAPRWQNDQRYFVDAVKQMEGIPMVLVANNDAKKQLSQAKELIRKGAMVLVVIPVDQATAAEIVNLAHKKEIRVIAYDRLINNCRLDYYVSTDNVRVGEIQAQYLTKIKPKGNYALIGGPPNDNNSRMLYIGQMNILQPFVERDEIKISFRQFANAWTPEEGYRLAKACLDSTANKVDAIICANDAMAMGAIIGVRAHWRWLRALVHRLRLDRAGVHRPSATAILTAATRPDGRVLAQVGAGFQVAIRARFDVRILRVELALPGSRTGIEEHLDVRAVRQQEGDEDLLVVLLQPPDRRQRLGVVLLPAWHRWPLESGHDLSKGEREGDDRPHAC